MAYNSMEQRLARLRAKLEIDKTRQAAIEEMNLRRAELADLEEQIGPQIENLEWHPNARVPAHGLEFVYFVECNEFVKIGYTTRVRMRFYDLVTWSPYTMRILLVIEGTREDERNYHLKFGKYFHKGEWFKKSPELMAFIEEKQNKKAQLS